MKIDLHSISAHSIEIFHRLRWGRSGVCCPRCGSIHIYNTDPTKIHICADCDKRFSDTTDTIFHSTKLPLSKWLYAIYLFCVQSRGISSYNLARSISVSQPTAWRMLYLIRSTLHRELKIDSKDIMMDEVWIGADWKKMPFKDKLKKCKQYGVPIPQPKGSDKHSQLIFKGALRHTLKKVSNMDKVCVVGLLQNKRFNKRSLSLHPFIYSQDRSLKISQFIKQIREISNEDSIHLTSDDSSLYDLFDHHSICNHSQHVYISEDGYSSNPLEGAFSHLRRVWRGIYTWWSDKYFLSYLDEYCWRFNGSGKTVLEKMEEVFNFA